MVVNALKLKLTVCAQTLIFIFSFKIQCGGLEIQNYKKMFQCQYPYGLHLHRIFPDLFLFYFEQIIVHYFYLLKVYINTLLPVNWCTVQKTGNKHI